MVQKANMSRGAKENDALLDELAQGKLRAAFHEAGQFIAAKHFRVAQASGLHRIGKSTRFAGKTVFSPTSPFNTAVVGWAGALAEAVFVHRSDKWKAIQETVWQLFGENLLTKNDSDLIARHRDTRKTFAQATKILTDNYDELKETAKELARLDSAFNVL
jgi:hypothetical protein